MKKHLPIAIALTISSQAATIIGGDTANGNFNADTSTVDQRTFADTPNWFNLAGAETVQGSRSNLAPTDGSRNAVLAVGRDFINNASWTVGGAGEVFQVGLEWRDAFNWDDPADTVEIFFFTETDNLVDANTAPGDITPLGSIIPVPFSTTNNTYESYNNLAGYTTTAADTGKVVFAGIRMNPVEGTANEFARFDNFNFSVESVPEPSSALLGSLALLGLLRRKR